MAIFLGIVGAVVALWAGHRLYRSHLLAQARTTPFPEEWRTLLKDRFPLFNCLNPDERIRLEGDVQVFLQDKHFEGCGGVELTEPMQVCIAAQACFLLAGQQVARPYPRLKTVLVYPQAYVAGEDGQVRLGESWSTGVVVLAWDDVQHGALDVHDGNNVVFHEFAHQLDQADGVGDGAPQLASSSRYRSWARVLGKEYEALQKRSKKGRRSVIRDYGATNPAEFFATATEAFFEKPHSLQKKHPELYAELREYYKLDPNTWENPS